MAKFTRTAYASGSLRDLAQEIAHLSGITGQSGNAFAYDHLHPRAGKGRKRVRITITVEPEKAPVRPRGPKRSKPVQLALDVADPGPYVPDTHAGNRWLLEAHTGGSTP